MKAASHDRPVSSAQAAESVRHGFNQAPRERCPTSRLVVAGPAGVTTWALHAPWLMLVAVLTLVLVWYVVHQSRAQARRELARQRTERRVRELMDRADLLVREFEPRWARLETELFEARLATHATEIPNTSFLVQQRDLENRLQRLDRTLADLGTASAKLDDLSSWQESDRWRALCQPRLTMIQAAADRARRNLDDGIQQILEALDYRRDLALAETAVAAADSGVEPFDAAETAGLIRALADAAHGAQENADQAMLAVARLTGPQAEPVGSATGNASPDQGHLPAGPRSAGFVGINLPPPYSPTGPVLLDSTPLRSVYSWPANRGWRAPRHWLGARWPYTRWHSRPLSPRLAEHRARTWAFWPYPYPPRPPWLADYGFP